MSWSFNSEDARAKRSEMVAGGSERPARMMGLGGSGGDSEDEVLMTTVSGEPCGDKGGGESLIMLSWGLATAFPFPLSTFGASFSSLKRSCDFSSLGAPSARLAAFFWISLNLWAIRSEIVAVLTGLSRGLRRGEVVYLSLRALFGANLALQFNVYISNACAESICTHSSSASSALRTLERYVFLSLKTCTRELQQDVKLGVGRTFAPRLELVRSS